MLRHMSDVIPPPGSCVWELLSHPRASLLATVNPIAFIFHESVKAFFDIISESIVEMSLLVYLLIR